MSLRTVTVTAPMGGVMPGPNQDKFDQKLPPRGSPARFSRLSAALGVLVLLRQHQKGFPGLMCPDLAGSSSRDNSQL